MRLLKKIAYACCSVTLGLLALTGCEGGELYDVNAPDWISDKIQEIEDSKKQPEEEVLEGMQEDVYTIGNTDFTSGWWAAFSKYYVVPDGEKWNAVINLHINRPTTRITRTLPLSSPTMWIVEVQDMPNTESSALTSQVALKLTIHSGAIISISSTSRARCFSIPMPAMQTLTYRVWAAR